MSVKNHLYVILYPSPSLVASQCSPEEFARHYVSGSTRYYDGKVLFFEMDPEFRDPYFPIEEALKELVPHEDGRPKATKFVKTYRIIEHIDFSMMRNLYITNPDGTCLELEESTLEPCRRPGILRVFAEINPLSMLVLTKMNYLEFGEYITDPGNNKSAPKVCYTQLQFDCDTFLEEIHENPFMVSPVPSINPSKLRDACEELRAHPEKTTKGLSLASNLNQIPYKFIRHGFMFAAPGQNRFYRMPKGAEIEQKNMRFWLSM